MDRGIVGSAVSARATLTPTAGLTCGMSGLEAKPLYRGVGDEPEVHPVARGDQRFWEFAATQAPKDGCLVAVTVKGLQMVVGTLLVLLDLELAEGLKEGEMEGLQRFRLL